MGRFKWSKEDAMTALGLAEPDSDNLVQPLKQDEVDELTIRFGRDEAKEKEAENVPPLEDPESSGIGQDMYNDVLEGDQEGVPIPIMDDAQRGR